MTSIDKQPCPSRLLGEGYVEKICKRYMFVEDSRVGKIYIPLEAATPKAPECTDLRNRFDVGSHVAFTAVKQSERDKSQRGCSYVACSIILKSELQTVCGKIVEVLDTYAYVDVPKLGRVFVPYSAKMETGRPWHGKNASVGKNIYMQVLPQPEVHKCCFVAFLVSLERLSFPSNPHGRRHTFSSMSTSTRTDRQPEFVENIVGIIVIEPSDRNEGLIYSQTTGSISFEKTVFHSKCEAGMFVYFIAQKFISEQHEKCTWKATKVELIGKLNYVDCDIIQNRFSAGDCLTISVHAIVCRVSHCNSSAWLWNDLVGRIFVNNHHYVENLHPFDVVYVKAQFTAAFEDVPWSAISVRLIRENEDRIREELGQLMCTEDHWKVLHVQEQPNGGFYGFLEHPINGAAFMAWTDLNYDEGAPSKHTICRVTAYNQHRDQRHPWRALLVTPLLNNSIEPSHEHPKYSVSGIFHPKIANLIQQQHTKLSNLRPLPTNGWTVPSATVTNSRILTQHKSSSSNTSIDSGRSSSGISGVSGFRDFCVIEPPPGFGEVVTPSPIGAERALLHQSEETTRSRSTDSPAMFHNPNFCATFSIWQNDVVPSLSASTSWKPLDPLESFSFHGSNSFLSDSCQSSLDGSQLNTPLENAIDRNISDDIFDGLSCSPPGVVSEKAPDIDDFVRMLLNKNESNVFDEQFERFLVAEVVRRPYLVHQILKELPDGAKTFNHIKT